MGLGRDDDDPELGKGFAEACHHLLRLRSRQGPVDQDNIRPMGLPQVYRLYGVAGLCSNLYSYVGKKYMKQPGPCQGGVVKQDNAP